MHKVNLRPEEMERACWTGVKRNLEAVANGLKAGWGGPSECWEAHIQGALAELAFAKWMQTYWEGHVNTFRSRDDVIGFEVRWASNAQLKRRPKDEPNRKFVLVTGEIPTFYVRGWLWGHEFETLGRKMDPGNRGRPAWFVTPEQLRPMSEIN